VRPDTVCIAQPNEGFFFNSWTEDFGHESSLIIHESKPSPYPSFIPTPLSNFFSTTFGPSPNDNPAVLRLNQHGKFTANFKEGAPLIQPSAWIPLYGVIFSTIIGFSIPSISKWIKESNQRRRLGQYQKAMDYLYLNDKLGKENNKKQGDLKDKIDELKDKIKTAYAKGKIDEQQYEELRKEISILYQRTYIDMLALNESFINKDLVQLDKIRDHISRAYTIGEITQQHYSDLKNRISIMYEETYNKKINSLGDKFDSSRKNDDVLLESIKYDVEDGYAKGKITEQHYNLLNEKISKRQNN